MTLRSSSGQIHAVGDDRELLNIRYGTHGPPPDWIATGDGGNPFTESGWTSWFDLDHGYSVASRSVSLAPCGQTGVLALAIDGVPSAAAPVDRCDTETDVATVATAPLGPGTPARAEQPGQSRSHDRQSRWGPRQADSAAR